MLTVDPGYRPPFTLGLEIGAGVGGFYGSLRSPPGFAPNRPLLFPIPSAPLDAVFAARAGFSYELARFLPGQVRVGWEHYGGQGEAILFGYDPMGALFLRNLKDIQNDYDDRTSHDEHDPHADHRYHDYRDDIIDMDIPQLLMRDSPAETAIVRSRVDVNLIDFAYTLPLFGPDQDCGPGLAVWAKVGSRAGWFYADDRAVGSGYAQTVSNWYSGVGPVAGVRTDILYGDPVAGRRPALSLAVDGGVLFGESRVRFREVDLSAPNPVYREAAVTGERDVPFVSAELSLGFHTGPILGSLTTVGVRYTQFWGIGRVGNSDQDFLAVVGFLRYEMPF